MRLSFFFLVLLTLGLPSPSAGFIGRCDIVLAFSAIELIQPIARLYETNQALQKSEAKPHELLEAGYWQASPETVFNIKDGQPNPEDPLPLQRVDLPFAHTGMYLPDSVDLANPGTLAPYQGVFILMPGIGANISNASNLFNLGLTLMKGKNPALSPGEGKPKIRLLPVLLDSTLGGLGAKSPKIFGHPKGAIEIVRHARLLMDKLFPRAPTFVGGRSQGGLIAMEYADHYGGIEGVVAVNPSITVPSLHYSGIAQVEESAAQGQAHDTDIYFNETWDIYRNVTPNYRSFDLRRSPWDRVRLWWYGKTLQTPLLLLIGKNDPSYGGAPYVEHCQRFADAAPYRELSIFDVPQKLSHDLWSRADKSLFKRVGQRMSRFIQAQLAP